MSDDRKFRMVIDPMPGNFSSRNSPEKTGLWQVVMYEVDEWGAIIKDSPDNQVQQASMEYDRAFTVCNQLQKQLEEAERNRKKTGK